MKTLKTVLVFSLLGSMSLAAQAGGDISAGKAIVAEKCQACHGADGNSPTPMYPRLSGQHANYIVQALTEYKDGTRNNAIMSGFAAGLSEQDRKDVAAWFSSQSGLFTPVEPRTVSE